MRRKLICRLVSGCCLFLAAVLALGLDPGLRAADAASGTEPPLPLLPTSADLVARVLDQQRFLGDRVTGLAAALEVLRSQAEATDARRPKAQPRSEAQPLRQPQPQSQPAAQAQVQALPTRRLDPEVVRAIRDLTVEVARMADRLHRPALPEGAGSAGSDDTAAKTGSAGSSPRPPARAPRTGSPMSGRAVRARHTAASVGAIEVSELRAARADPLRR